MSDNNLNEIIGTLRELEDDASIPKNIKLKVQTTISILEKEEELTSIRINKALNELEEIADDTNMQSYIRTQILNIVSLLEKIVS